MNALQTAFHVDFSTNNLKSIFKNWPVLWFAKMLCFSVQMFICPQKEMFIVFESVKATASDPVGDFFSGNWEKMHINKSPCFWFSGKPWNVNRPCVRGCVCPLGDFTHIPGYSWAQTHSRVPHASVIPKQRRVSMTYPNIHSLNDLFSFCSASVTSEDGLHAF